MIVVWTISFLLAGCGLIGQVWAAESISNAEERYQILNSKLQTLIETQETFLRRCQELEARVTALTRELAKAKEEGARPNSQYVTREELKKVVDAVQELDRKREADKKLILDSLSDLKNLPVPAAPTAPKPSAEKKEDSEKWVYTVGEGDTALAIINAYNERMKAEGRTLITLSQVRKANPDVNIDRIRPGEQIYIPVPAKKRP